MPPYQPQEIKTTWSRILNKYPRSSILSRIGKNKIGMGAKPRWIIEIREKMTQFFSQEAKRAYEGDFAIDSSTLWTWLFALPYIIGDRGAVKVWGDNYIEILKYLIRSPGTALMSDNPKIVAEYAVPLITLKEQVDYISTEFMDEQHIQRTLNAPEKLLIGYYTKEMASLLIRAQQSVGDYSNGASTYIADREWYTKLQMFEMHYASFDGRVPFLYANLGMTLGEWNWARMRNSKWHDVVNMFIERLKEAAKDLMSNDNSEWRYECYDIVEFIFSTIWAENIAKAMDYDLSGVSDPHRAMPDSLVWMTGDISRRAKDLVHMNKMLMKAWGVPEEEYKHHYHTQQFDLVDGYGY